jgi:hypothetical protein
MWKILPPAILLCAMYFSSLDHRPIQASIQHAFQGNMMGCKASDFFMRVFIMSGRVCCPAITITGGRLARSYSTKCLPSRLLSISLLILVKNFMHRIITSTFNTNPSPFLTFVSGDFGHIPVCAKTSSTAQNAHPGLLAALSFHSSVVCPVITHTQCILGFVLIP